MKEKRTTFKIFQSVGCLVKVNIPFNEKKKSLVIYTDKSLEMFPLNDN